MFRRGAILIAILAAALWAQSSANEAFERALELHKAGDFAHAIEAYRQSLALDPDNFQARSNLGAALTHEGRYDEAIEQYEAALASAPPPARAPLRLNLALAYYKSGRIAQAAGELAALHAKDPANKQITMLLADCDLRLGHPRETIALLDPMPGADPDDEARNYLLGVALIRDGQLARGQQMVDRILKQGDSAEAHFLLGSQMFQSGDFPGAIKEFQKAIALDAALPSLYSYYGQALLNTGDPDGAIAAFSRALAADPNDYEANLRKGEILNQRNQNTNAVPFLERAARLRPDSTEARRELAIARNPALARTTEAAPAVDGPPDGSLAPDFTLPRIGSPESVHLAAYRGKGPVLVVFGSYTCPFFRSAAPNINLLYAKYGTRLPFLLVYVREAHSTADWQSTRNDPSAVLPPSRTIEEKRDHAILCRRKLHIAYPALVDGMDRKTERQYAAWPSRLYLIASDGRIAYQTGLSEQDFHLRDLEARIAAELGR